MVRWLSVFLVVFACVAVAGLYDGRSEAQVIVVEGEGGEGMEFGGAFAIAGECGLFPIVWKLGEDNEWQSAKDELIQRATNGELVEVVYNIERFRRDGVEEKVSTRIGAVLGALEKQGVYPLDKKMVAAEAKSIQSTLATLQAEKATDAMTIEVMMALNTAHKQLKRAAELLDAGKPGAPNAPQAPGAVRGK